MRGRRHRTRGRRAGLRHVGPVGLLALHMLGSFAQFERELLVERTREGHLRRLHAGDWSCGPAPLVDADVFGQAQALMATGREVRPPAQAAAEYLLTGLLRCGVCGRPMCGKTRRKGGTAHRYYICNGGARTGDGRRQGASVVGERVETAVEVFMTAPMTQRRSETHAAGQAVHRA